MNIDYLVPRMYANFDLESLRNSGGGMQPNVNARVTALRERYKVNVVHEVEELSAGLCLIESLWFSGPHWPAGASIEEYNEVVACYAERLEALCATPSTKLLICSEMEIARVRWWARSHFTDDFQGVLVSCRYLFDIARALGVVPIAYLNDCIDPYLFKMGKKKLTVVGLGGLKHIKNAYLLFEVFERLKDTPVETVYIGSAKVWSGENRAEDLALVGRMRECVDVWYPNASYVQTAYHLSSAAIGINDTWHDCSSRSNQEMLMAGIVTVSGRHPVFRERPGIHGLKTADEFVGAIDELTNGFSEVPLAKCRESREWAVRTVSTEVFHEQFAEILRGVYL